MPNQLQHPSLFLAWSEAPWDEAVTGYPVWQISHVSLSGPDADAAMVTFEATRDYAGVGLVSCRLQHDRLRESMFLESHGFRFIEMVYQPELALAGTVLVEDIQILPVRPAREGDLPALLDIAGTAFRNERFHMDPRLGDQLSRARYQNWVRTSLDHPSQRLLVMTEGEAPVAFFVTEILPDKFCYWHLNAVAPAFQGQGYGLRAWRSMILYAASAGLQGVRTSIFARNERVLNLYTRLDFRFHSP